MIAMKDLMDHLAGRLVGAGMKNVYAYPKSPIQVPGFVIGYPTDINFDLSFNRGGDEWVFPVYHVVGKNLDEETRDSLSDAIAGATGIKATLEDNPMTGCSVHVTDCSIGTITIAGVELLSATYTVEVITQNG